MFDLALNCRKNTHLIHVENIIAIVFGYSSFDLPHLPQYLY